MNATVGGSLLAGLLAAPAVAAATLLVARAPATGRASSGHGSARARSEALNAVAGPLAVVLSAALDALLFSCVGLLFLLASLPPQAPASRSASSSRPRSASSWASSRRPSRRSGAALVVGFGGIAVVLLVFARSDLLAAATAAFGGGLLVCLVPLLVAALRPARARARSSRSSLPLAVLALRRGGGPRDAAAESPTAYEDLAPHVKRIVERERIKAEIDAANRIQAALLPSVHPELGTASVASHYRAATEIGGDYFDFLPLPEGRLGLAFGDVAGHGLTSGIVMAMTKAALLVQVRLRRLARSASSRS